MNILHIMKPDLKDVRDMMAAGYRKLRRENPAKARELRRRMKAGIDHTESSLQQNLYTNVAVQPST